MSETTCEKCGTSHGFWEKCPKPPPPNLVKEIFHGPPPPKILEAIRKKMDAEEPSAVKSGRHLSAKDKAAIDAAWEQFKTIPPVRR